MFKKLFLMSILLIACTCQIGCFRTATGDPVKDYFVYDPRTGSYVGDVFAYLFNAWPEPAIMRQRNYFPDSSYEVMFNFIKTQAERNDDKLAQEIMALYQPRGRYYGVFVPPDNISYLEYIIRNDRDRGYELFRKIVFYTNQPGRYFGVYLSRSYFIREMFYKFTYPYLLRKFPGLSPDALPRTCDYKLYYPKPYEEIQS